MDMKEHDILETLVEFAQAKGARLPLIQEHHI